MPTKMILLDRRTSLKREWNAPIERTVLAKAAIRHVEDRERIQKEGRLLRESSVSLCLCGSNAF
ncbi:hypothetical protein PROAA_380008 [Candidatus Propionivibrio aalborgensis]|uniref:Uncharacterized protein n=1 Tax=Candidatus Propionivibrio aalborgensis TaxID=1860101 RepID=A0A1A8XZH7_9RHOO|nr:hypothetical protein PROAA_380008 [Candidatus Propionivibrio aalborgensis]